MNKDEMGQLKHDEIFAIVAKTYKGRYIQQLRGQNFAIFWPNPPSVDIFYTLSMEKK